MDVMIKPQEIRKLLRSLLVCLHAHSTINILEPTQNGHIFFTGKIFKSFLLKKDCHNFYSIFTEIHSQQSNEQ